MRLILRSGDACATATFQNRLFDAFLSEGESVPTKEALWPAVEVTDAREVLQIMAEVPGIDPHDIDISIVGSALTIQVSSRKDPRLLRTVALPVAVDVDHGEAIHEAGVLNITLPKLKPNR